LGSNQYQYDVTLVTQPGEDIFELHLDVPTDLTNILDVFAPPGWGSISDPFAPGFLLYGDNGSGGTFIESIADLGADAIGPASLPGFGFISSSIVNGPILSSVNFGGPTSAPVPEPTTIFLLGAGLAGLAFGRKHKMSE
jgi:hypothetical protein